MRRVVSLVALLGWATTVSAAPAGQWQAAGPFKIAPVTDRCVAAASFARDGKTLVVALESNPTNEKYEMRVYAPGKIWAPWQQTTFSLGNAKPERNWVVVKPSSQRGNLIYIMGTSRSELASAGDSPDLRIEGKLSPGRLTLTALASAFPLLENCTSDLLERWGYSRDFQRSVMTPPKPLKDWSSYASSYDYPASAVSLRLQGDVHAVIDVSTDGLSSNCRIIRSSGHKDLDDTTCMIVTKRARYQPAQDKDGQPVAAPLYLTFHWEVPLP